jgi:hypothetical protein
MFENKKVELEKEEEVFEKKTKQNSNSNLYFGKTKLPKSTEYFSTSSVEHMENLDIFLEDEKSNNQKDGWSKLDKCLKLKKLLEFVDLYAEENNLLEEEKISLNDFLKESLEKRKLYRVKDVNYDKQLGIIKQIHGLVFNKQKQRFSLKSHDTLITRKTKPATLECV